MSKFSVTSSFYQWWRVRIIHDLNLTLSQTTIFRLFQTERVCRRQFQVWWKLQKVLQRVENTVGKGEIALCFQKNSNADTWKQGLVRKRDKIIWQTSKGKEKLWQPHGMVSICDFSGSSSKKFQSLAPWTFSPFPAIVLKSFLCLSHWKPW